MKDPPAYTRHGRVLPVATICYLLLENEVLLGEKLRGLGAGRWNGFGGKVEADETVLEAATRETLEEACEEPLELDLVAMLRFYFPDGILDQEAHVFLAHSWRGEPAPTAEMTPRWFPLDKLPYESMWPDNRYWLSLVLKGVRLTGDFYLENESLVSAFSLYPGVHGGAR